MKGTRRLSWWIRDHVILIAGAVFVIACVLVIHPHAAHPDSSLSPTLSSSSSRLVVVDHPHIVYWMIGNKMGPVFDKAAVIDPDMTVYPVTPDVVTIYPANIPLSAEIDPRSGYYALGYEGTLQPNIYYDPLTKKFYNRFITAPTIASEVMNHDPTPDGIRAVDQAIAMASFGNVT